MQYQQGMRTVGDRGFRASHAKYSGLSPIPEIWVSWLADLLKGV